LFGPDVNRVLETLKTEMEGVRAGKKSEILDTLIAREWKHMFGGFTKDPAMLSRPT
jgi:hypothetical protein